MRNDCTVGKLSERNEAGDEEVICRRNWSCVSGVGVAQPQSELYVRSRKWTVPLQELKLIQLGNRNQSIFSNCARSKKIYLRISKITYVSICLLQWAIIFFFSFRSLRRSSRAESRLQLCTSH